MRTSPDSGIEPMLARWNTELFEEIERQAAGDPKLWRRVDDPPESQILSGRLPTELVYMRGPEYCLLPQLPVVLTERRRVRISADGVRVWGEYEVRDADDRQRVQGRNLYLRLYIKVAPSGYGDNPKEKLPPGVKRGAGRPIVQPLRAIEQPFDAQGVATIDCTLEWLGWPRPLKGEAPGCKWPEGQIDFLVVPATHDIPE